MKKHIIIISSNDASVGTPTDVRNYTDFFTSAYGGYWDESEIENLDNMTASELQGRLEEIKLINYDYLICIFTGHGGMDDSQPETILKLASGDKLAEHHLHKLARRQLTILDCCREYEGRGVLITESVKRGYVKSAASVTFRKYVREKYEESIMNALEAQYVLYACPLGDESYGNSEWGGHFSHALIEGSVGRCTEMEDRFLTINEAFSIAEEICCNHPTHPQSPIAFLPECSQDRSLIWAISHQTLGRLYTIWSAITQK